LGTSAFSKGIQQGEFIAKSLDICKALAEVAFSKGSNSSLFIINDCFVAIMSIAKSMPNITSSNALLEFCNNCLQNTQSMQKEMKLAIRDGLLVVIMVSIYYSDYPIHSKKTECHQ
jgi:DNA mismatch repair ATPase MutS